MPRTQIKPTQKQTPVAAIKTAVPSATHEPAVVPERKLSIFQNTLCELASDLIHNGGQSADVRDFLEALASHHLSREFPDFDNSKGVARLYEEWRHEFGRLLPGERVGVTYRKPITVSVSDAVRANLRCGVADKLDGFLPWN